MSFLTFFFLGGTGLIIHEKLYTSVVTGPDGTHICLEGLKHRRVGFGRDGDVGVCRVERVYSYINISARHVNNAPSCRATAHLCWQHRVMYEVRVKWSGALLYRIPPLPTLPSPCYCTLLSVHI